MMNKFIFYISHLIKMSQANPVRSTLTSIGIFVAVFLFSCGNIISTSYYSMQTKQMAEMTEHTVVLRTNNQSYIINDLGEDFEKIESLKDYVSSEQISIGYVNLDNNYSLTVKAFAHYISSPSDVLPEFTENGVLIPAKARLIAGRFFDAGDFLSSNVVVIIDELTEAILFDGDSAIGKKIPLGSLSGGSVSSELGQMVEYAEVIGVIGNSFADDKKWLQLKQKLKNENISNEFVSVSIYMPFNGNVEETAEMNTVQMFFAGNENEAKFLMKKLYAQTAAGYDDYFEVYRRDTLMENLEIELRDTKILLRLLLAMVSAFSAISIMSITFFAVKERIPEIGIRKAFGASPMDIAAQIIFEISLLAMIVSVVAASFSFLVCKYAEHYMNYHMFIMFKIEISTGQVFAPAFVGVIVAFASSLIPCIYAARIKVTKALRFE